MAEHPYQNYQTWSIPELPNDFPKSSSHHSAYHRSPLRTTISLRNSLVPTIIFRPPFYLSKELPDEAEKTGGANLLAHYGLSHCYHKYSKKKIKKKLSHALPHLPGNINKPVDKDDGTSLRSIIEKPPASIRELFPLSGRDLNGFRLHPGAIPERYTIDNQSLKNTGDNDGKRALSNKSEKCKKENSSCSGFEKKNTDKIIID